MIRSCTAIFTVICIAFLYEQSPGQNTVNLSFYNKLKNYDLSGVFSTDSIMDDANEKYKRPEPLGYIDSIYQRFQIHVMSIAKSKSNPYEYKITGKTKVKENICDFIGRITIINATYDTSDFLKKIGFPNYKQGFIVSQVEINEDKTQSGSGIIKGKLTSDIYFDDHGKIHYEALMLIADGFCNNQFEGKWTSYRSGKTKKCNWGDFRIPDSRNFDFGTGEFSVNPAYKKNGWENYGYGMNEEEWWKDD